MMAGKEQGALLTIGELADELGLPTHILRYWETRFPGLKPLTRAGNRRYYRPEDVALAHRINDLLNVRGYTIKGAEKLLASGGFAKDEGGQPARVEAASVAPPKVEPVSVSQRTVTPAADPAPFAQLGDLQKIRNRLAEALANSQV